MSSPITCHVLDASLGKPAAGVRATLVRLLPDGGNEVIATGETNADGRIPTLVSAPDAQEKLAFARGGTFRITFATAQYFEAMGRESFYPFVDVSFIIPPNPERHYHVPLLLSPFSYTTYRGS